MSDGIINRYNPLYTVKLNPKLTLKHEIRITAKMHNERSLIRFDFAVLVAISLAEVLVRFILSNDASINVSTNQIAILIGVLTINLQILYGSLMNQKIMLTTLFTKFCSRFVVFSYEKKSDSEGAILVFEMLSMSVSFESRIKFCIFSFDKR